MSSGDESATEPGDHITALDYLEDESLIVGTSNGYLVLHNVDCDFTEIVGSVEGGIKSINCSPDGALLTVITGIGQLLLMTHDWEVLYEVSFDSQFLAVCILLSRKKFTIIWVLVLLHYECMIYVPNRYRLYMHCKYPLF